MHGLRRSFATLSEWTKTPAGQLGVSRVAFLRVINGRAAISAELAIRLAPWLGGSAKTWLRAQLQYDLWHAEQKSEKHGESEARQEHGLRLTVSGNAGPVSVAAPACP